jgi:hypothetical protein
VPLHVWFGCVECTVSEARAAMQACASHASLLLHYRAAKNALDYEVPSTMIVTTGLRAPLELH